jgi:hypothetical protein
MPDYYESPVSSSPPERARLGLRPLVTALWCLGMVLVVAAIVGAAVLGTRVAERRLPEKANDTAFARDAVIRVRGSMEVPLVLALDQQGLREYYFRESSITGTGLEGIGDGSVFEHRGELGLRVLAADADLIQVEIVEGPRVEERFWMHRPTDEQTETGDEEGF